MAVDYCYTAFRLLRWERENKNGYLDTRRTANYCQTTEHNSNQLLGKDVEIDEQDQEDRKEDVDLEHQKKNCHFA